MAAAVLEKAWARLRRQMPELPAAVVVVLDARSRKRRWGQFAASTWRVRRPEAAHEIAVSPELFADAAALLATLVHEAVHAALLVAEPDNPRHVGGVSPDRRGYLYYHRVEFRDAARQSGLECEYVNGRYGWTLTRWPASGVPLRYRAVLRFLERSLPWGAASGPVERPVRGRPTPISGWVSLRCGCRPARTIHVARGQASGAAIRCDACNCPFVVGSLSV
jgi:hypothetical protein